MTSFFDGVFGLYVKATPRTPGGHRAMTDFFDGVLGLHVGKIVGTQIVVQVFGERQICIAFDPSHPEDVIERFSVEEPGVSQRGLTYEEALEEVREVLDKEFKHPFPVWILPFSPGITLAAKDDYEVVCRSADIDYLGVRRIGEKKIEYVEKARILPKEEGFANHVAKQNRRQLIKDNTERNGYRTHDWLAKQIDELLAAKLKEADEE